MKKHLLKLTKILVVFALMLNVFEPLMVLAAKPTTAEKGQIYNPQTDTVGDSATITEGSFTNPGDVQVQKIVSKTTTEGVYNVEFKVRGKKVQETSVRPVYAVVVMDTSGSMRNTAGNPKWTNAVNGAKTFASTLLQEIPTAQIALVTFAGDKYPNQAWDDAEVRREFASSNLNNVNFGSAEGGTNVEAGLREARILLSNTSIPSNAAKFVVLVGDGEPTFYYDDNGKTQGPGNGYSEESIQEAYGEANLIKTAGVDVYTLGYSVTPGGTAETVLKNIASKPENYFAASPEQVSAAFIAIATQISTFAAGVNPTVVDNAGSAFTITSGSGTLSLEGDITEEWKSVGSLQITIDGNSPTGWYPTNDGFTLSYTDYNNVNQTIDYNTNPEVYWIQNKYNYVINYYKDSISSSNFITKEEGEAFLGEEITADTTVHIPPGYKFVGEAPKMTIVETGNVLNVVYVKDTFGYKVEYYYDNVKNDNLTVTGSAEYGSTINTYTDKLIAGYELEKTENFPLTVSENENNNVIKVYYKKGQYNYTVNYYYDNVQDTTATENKTAYYLDVIETYEEKNKTGYKLSHVNGIPLTIGANPAENYINVYYVKNTFGYTVEYYYDGVIDTSKTESGTALFESQITTYTDKNITGYKLEKTENLPLTIGANPDNNVIKVYYVKNTYAYTVEYYYDGVINNSKTESGTALFGSQITTYIDKNVVGYKFDKTENLPLTITAVAANNVIKVYYVKNMIGYTVEYYYDGVINNSKTESGTALFGSQITTYTDKNIAGYKFDKTENLPLTITGVAANNVIKVYYVKDSFAYTVEYYYDGIINNSKTENGTALFGSQITGYTDKNITGYKLEKEENLPLTITEVAANNVIKIYYVKNTYGYTVEYYYDGVIDNSKTESGTALYNSKITTYTDKNITGYKLEKEEGLPLTITEVTANNVIKVYYIKDTFTYTVEYYYDGVINSSKTENGTALYNSKITTYTDKNIAGYKLDKEENLPLTITEVAANNVIRVYYVKDTFAYRIEYYYDNVIDSSKTETSSALYQDVISTYTDKNITGYRLDKTENLPLVVGNVENNNVIKVYYVKNTYQFKVFYFYDNLIDSSKTETSSASYQDVIDTYTDKNITGYRLDKTERLPLTISANPSENYINVYYVKDSFAYTVEYYYDGVIDSSKTETSSGVFESKITTYTDKNIVGYKLEKTENLPLTITEIAANNVIKVYYVKDSFGYTVEYYYDGIINNSKTENSTALFGSQITTYTDKNIAGYTLEKEEGLPLTITEVAANNVIKVYYVKDSFAYSVEYYYDGVIDSSKTESGTALYNSKITTYTDKNIAGYKLEKEENLPLTITEVTANNVIKVYYVKDSFAYTVEYYYDGVINNSKTESGTALFGSQITGYTDKNITGYVLEKTENLPLTITEVAENNVIKVYYVKDTFGYTVEYYYDEVIDEILTENLTATFEDVITTYTDKNITGYKLEKEEGLPLTITEVAEDNIIKVYYVKDTFGYTIEYYFDEVIDETLTENLTAIYGEEISTYPDKLIEGYILNKVIGCPLIVSEDPKKNVIQVHYVTYGQGTIEDPEPPHTEVVVSNNRSINTVYLYKKEEEEK